jgi:hypothetical protein
MPRGRALFGLLLVILGAGLLLGELEVFDFRGIVRTYWPVLLIVAGILLLRRSTPLWIEGPADPLGRHATFGSLSIDFSESGGVDTSTVFGDVKVTVTSPAFAGGKVSTVFGNAIVDLAAAGISPGTHTLRVNGVFGNTNLVLPAGVAYSMIATTTAGTLRVGDRKEDGFSPRIHDESPEFAASDRRLVLDASRTVGDITVRRG